MRIQNLKGHKEKYLKSERNEKKKFREGKVCEICRQPEGNGRPNQLTVHNHKLPKKFWMVFHRKCHDKIHGIERDEKNQIIHWWKSDKDDWYDIEQGWHEGELE